MASTANNANLISSLTTDFNVSPYYDDFNSGEKDFYRILFKPGYAVQARELTQIQSLSQSQLYRFGKHIFKEGSIVIPGDFTLKMNVGDKKSLGIAYVKIKDNDSLGNSVSIADLKGQLLTSQITGVSAKIEEVLENDGTNPKTLYFSTYQNASAGDPTIRTFVAGETLSWSGGTCVVVDSSPVGYASWFRIDNGVVFAKDHFISFSTQSTILERYNASPTCKVGFYITEEIITASSDSSLLDPALESSNYAAPGADRLKLTATLTVYPYDDTVGAPNFVTLFTVKNGVIEIDNNLTQYNILGDSMARRTYEESGDYIIKGYNTSIQEHDDTGSNYGRFDNGDNTKLIVGIDSGHGYVKGYPVTNNDKYEIEIDKPINDFLNVKSQLASTSQGSYVQVNEFVGTWELDKGNRINFYDQPQKRLTNFGVTTGGTYKGSNATQTGNNIGSGIINSLTYVSGTPGYDAIYNVYLSDVKMTGSNTFSNVRSLYSSTGIGLGADIVGSSNTTTNTVLQAITQAPLLYYAGSGFVRSVRASDGTGATTYYFDRTDGVSSGMTVGTGGTTTVTYVGSANELIPYTVGAVVSDIDVSQDIIMTLGGSTSIGPLWSGATCSASGNTVTGVGTYFNFLNVGDKIQFTGLSNTYYVAAITSNTVMTVSNTVSSVITSNTISKVYRIGDIVNLTGKGATAGGKRTVTMGGSNTTFTIDLKETFPNTVPTTVTYKVAKTNASEVTKTLNPNRYVVINCATAGTTGPFCLGFSDVYQIRNIVKKTGSAPSNLADGTDVTKYFILDNGQRDTQYDLAYIINNGDSLGATDYLLVHLDYFSASNPGYFSINSYPIQDNDALASNTTIRTEDVAIFTSPSSNKQYDLRNHLDFRPVKTKTALDGGAGVSSGAGISTNPSNNSTTYVNTSNGLKFPVPAESLLFDYSHYLGRKDIVVITKDGTLLVTKGVPSANPVVPDPLDTQMLISVLDIAPYPSLSPAYGNVINRRDLACGQKKVSVRGYTMRDIGILEQRIKTLEYYTSLTLLEKDVLSLKVLDANGNERFKNGYFIDTFKDASLSAKGIDPDFRIVFDETELAIRPLFSSDSFKYVPLANNGTAIRGSKVTFEYSEVDFFFQPRVTNVRNLERGTYYFRGLMNIFPNQDIWIDTSFAPDEVVTFKTDNSLLSISTSAERDVAAAVTKSFMNTTYEPWKKMLVGYNLYRGQGTSKVFVGRFDSEYQARAAAAQWTTQPAYWRGDAPWYSPQGDSATLETVYDNTRTGTNWFANQSLDSAAGGNKLISSEKIPYIRPQELVVEVRGMKPHSKVHAFFDGRNMSAYCTPLTQPQFVIALAKNPLPPGTVAAQGSDLIIDETGSLFFILKLPADDPRFKIGDRTLYVLDSELASLPTTVDSIQDASTVASADFFADGTKQTLQRTVYSTDGYKKTGETFPEQYNSYNDLVLPNTFVPPRKPGHCCFDPEAKVLMADLTWKAICDVTEGDKVMGDEGVVNTVVRNNKVIVGDRKMMKFKGVSFYTTDDHLFMTDKGWKTWDPVHVMNDPNTRNKDFLKGENQFTSINDNDSLKVYDIVHSDIVPKFVPYADLEAEAHDFDPYYEVHDLSLEDGGNFTYIVEGFVTHNCCIAYTVGIKVPGDEEGAFITSFDVFVAAKSATRPMWFEIREMDSGGNVTDISVPGSYVIVPNADIPISTNGKDNPLNVKFDAPIFLFNNKIYAFVIHSYSEGIDVDPDTSIWISRLGETDKNTGQIIDDRQRMGSFFQTTNNKQWYTVPDVDLTINIYRAKFNTGTATFVCGQEPVEKFFLSNVSSSLIGRVGDHFVSGDTLTLTGVTTSSGNTIAVTDKLIGNTSLTSASGNVISIPGSSKYVTSNTLYQIGEKVSVFQSNGYFKGITGIVSAIANSSAQLSYYDESTGNIYAEFVTSTGGFDLGSTIRSVRDSGYNYRANVASVGDYRYSAISFEPNVLDFSKTALKYQMQTYANASTTASSYEDIIPSETHYFSEEKVVYSRTNELSKISGDRSNKIQVILESNSEYVSPLFDLASSHTIFVDNLINANTYGDGANTTLDVTAKSGGYGLNKYISQTITLADGQDAEDISLILSAYRPPNTDVKVYLKILNSNDPDPLAQKGWIELVKQGNGDTLYSSLSNRYDYRELNYGFPTSYMTGPRGEVQYTSAGTTYTSYKYFAIKIVLTATNSAIVPRVADLRCIALQI